MPESVRTGVWFVGARGSVATTAVVGAAAVGSGIVPPTGMVTAVPSLPEVTLAHLGSLVFGGQDVVSTPLVKRAEELAADGVFAPQLVSTVADRLTAADADIVTVPLPGDDASPAEAARRLTDDLVSFRHRHRLDTAVVVNVASTEPPPPWEQPPATGGALSATLQAGWEACPASVVVALGAIDAGCAFVDFTPGAATTVPALAAMAAERGLPLAGRDGKTGETLLKTALAPMFADRGLQVLSWSGTNLLGGGDGARLADPRYAAAKVGTKGRALDAILPGELHTSVHIDLVPDLGQWKTAWDHIHFEGFLGTRMTLQFTWQGCDSALAAPLVLDLARLTAAAAQRGIGGPIPELGFFFKDPVGSDQHRLGEQYAALCRWLEAL